MFEDPAIFLNYLNERADSVTYLIDNCWFMRVTIIMPLAIGLSVISVRVTNTRAVLNILSSQIFPFPLPPEIRTLSGEDGFDNDGTVQAYRA